MIKTGQPTVVQQAKIVITSTLQAETVDPVLETSSLHLKSANSQFSLNIIDGDRVASGKSFNLDFPDGIERVVAFSSDSDAKQFADKVNAWTSACSPNYDVTASWLANNVPMLGNAQTSGNATHTTGFSISNCIVNWSVHLDNGNNWAISVRFLRSPQ